LGKLAAENVEEKRMVRENTMPGMSTIAEAIPSALQPCYCCSVTVSDQVYSIPRYYQKADSRLGSFYTH
jgi:hypothetical protein